MSLCVLLQVITMVLSAGQAAAGQEVFSGVLGTGARLGTAAAGGLSCPAMPGHVTGPGGAAIAAAGAAPAPGDAAQLPAAGSARSRDAGFNSTVLAIRSAPFLALVALRTTEDIVRFDVLDENGAVVESAARQYPGPDLVPGFEEPEKLLAEEAVVKLMKTHGLKKAAAEDPSTSRGFLLLLRPGNVGPSKGQLALVLVTGDGAVELDTFHPRSVVTVSRFIDPASTALVVSGQVEEPQAEEPVETKPDRRGYLLVHKLPASVKKLTNPAMAAAWAEAGDLFLAMQRYDDAGVALDKSLGLEVSAKALYQAALVHAHRGDWEKSAKRLGQLNELSTGEARVLQEAAAHVTLLRETRMRAMDINGSKAYSFKANAGFEGTSVWVKVKNADGKTVAMFKPTNSNTYHRGEVFTYQMAKLLGTEDLYPVSILVELDQKGCKKFNAALEGVTFKGPKDANRKKLMKRCASGKLEGVVKEWVPDFVFFSAISTSAKLQKHSIYRALQRTGAFPEKGKTQAVQTKTHLYKPDNCKEAVYKGVIEVEQLAKDLSDVLIMDVLNANEDRFPGANIEFHSLGKAVETKPCQFDFGPSRLFSLDNGATFKGTASNGFVDFTRRLKISRFRKETYDRLVALQQFIKGEGACPDFAKAYGIRSLDDLTRFLALDRGDSHPRRKKPFDLFATNLRNVLAYMKKFEKDTFAWFK